MRAKDYKTHLICPLTAGTIEQMRQDMLAAAAQGADMVEVRLDYLDSPPNAAELASLLREATVEVVVTYRPRREGGRFGGNESSRLAILCEAAKHSPAFIDLEMSTPRDQWPPARVIYSHHDFEALPADMEEIVTALDSSGAAINKITFASDSPADAMRALDMIRLCNKPTISLVMGEAGLLTRVLAKKFGAFGTFASLKAGAGSAPGQPTLEQFKKLYRWDSIGPRTAVYGVIGSPVAHSMSPAIHNAAFDALNMDAVYLPVLAQEGARGFTEFMNALLERPWLDWKGLSVTIPHKENALRYVGASNCDELSSRIGAINTVVIAEHGNIRGYNTDYMAAVDSLCSVMGISHKELAHRSVAVIGAGGVARAIVAALTHYKADVTIYNRTLQRGQMLAYEFSCRAAPLNVVRDSFAEILINCTSIGMHPDVEACPVEEIPDSVKVVFDTIYNPIQTVLLRRASQAGLLVVSGAEMFINQAAAQFKLWTGEPAPKDAMRKTLIERLGPK